jgi:hypothetical protein
VCELTEEVDRSLDLGDLDNPELTPLEGISDVAKLNRALGLSIDELLEIVVGEVVGHTDRNTPSPADFFHSHENIGGGSTPGVGKREDILKELGLCFVRRPLVGILAALEVKGGTLLLIQELL